jgi:hypothetical protein
MPDTLYTISLIATDPLMTERMRAAAAQEAAPGDPITWTWDRRYQLASAPGWAAAVDSALAGGITDWATDQAVISDTMITAQVQTLLTGPG